jgi:hypothetical protein
MRFVLLLGVVVSLTACIASPDKQWYKPNDAYTTAEFQRDRDQCTKGKVLDEDCLRQRGWIPISSDIQKKGPEQLYQKGRYGGY